MADHISAEQHLRLEALRLADQVIPGAVCPSRDQAEQVLERAAAFASFLIDGTVPSDAISFEDQVLDIVRRALRAGKV